ncbi:MAG: hypothetical protein LC777_08090 [Actinobacteria bacterium]|nr:hypothetical protein [Actinomycetota bacterium]
MVGTPDQPASDRQRRLLAVEARARLSPVVVIRRAHATGALGRLEERPAQDGRALVGELLGAAHDVGRGMGTLITSQEVADQLASDAIAAALKEERARRREAKRSAAQDGGEQAEPAGEAPEPVDEQAAKEERRRERERAEEERRSAVAHNMELGAQVAKLLAKVKLDERVVRIISAFGLASELDKVALRGARYGFPGWASEEQRRNGAVKHVYLDRGEAKQKARAFLEHASGPGEVAGRQIALLAMARYADEGAVAQSARAFYELAPGRDLPWSRRPLTCWTRWSRRGSPSTCSSAAARSASARPPSGRRSARTRRAGSRR